MILRRQLLLLINLGRVVRPFLNNSESVILHWKEIVHKRKAFRTAADLPKRGPSSKLLCNTRRHYNQRKTEQGWPVWQGFRRTLQHGFYVCKVASRQTRPKWRCLAINAAPFLLKTLHIISAQTGSGHLTVIELTIAAKGGPRRCGTMKCA